MGAARALTHVRGRKGAAVGSDVHRASSTPRGPLIGLRLPTRATDGDVPGASFETTWSRTVWVVAVGLMFFYLSNPLAVEPNFGLSFERALTIPLLAAVLSQPTFRLPRVPWAAVLFLVLMLASSIWSISPDQSRGIFEFYLKLAAAGLACAACASARTVAYGVTFGGVIVLVTSVYAYLAEIPGALVEAGTDGYLAGVGTNRNVLAYTLILAFAAAVAVVPRALWARAVWGAALAAISVGLFLAQSGTGFVAAALVTAAAVGLWAVRRWPGLMTGRGRVLLTLGAALALVLAVVGWPAVGVLLDRDTSTLSGRTELWGAIWRATSDVRILGQGWGTVWSHPWAPAPANHLFDVIYFDVSIPYSHGHNSLFDVLPEMGLVGVLAVLLVHLAVLRNGWVQMTPSATDEEWASARLAILGVLALALFGVTEPMATIPIGFFFLLALSGLGPRARTLRWARPRGGRTPGRRRAGAGAGAGADIGAETAPDVAPDVSAGRSPSA